MRGFRSFFVIAMICFLGCASSIHAALPASVDDFTYQLQNYPDGLISIRNSRFDLAVVDYSNDGMATGEWQASQIEDVKNNGPCNGKIVLAYLSIGEAEAYRFYWNPSWVDEDGIPVPGVAPDWLGPTNPDWEGNYKVRYWDPAWQLILLGTPSGASKSYLDRIIDAGFDGVYLDIVDAFEYWGPSDLGGTNENRQAAHDMVNLVEAIADYARVTRGHAGFVIVPQNGAAIIEPDAYPDASDPVSEAAAHRDLYFSTINAIGAEDAFFGGNLDENNPYNPDDYMIDLLKQFVAAAIPVLSIEYLTDPGKIQSFHATYAPSNGFIPYATVRALDRMVINNGFEPDCEESECTSLGGRIIMPSHHYSLGADCFCTAEICFPSESQIQPYPLFVILEVAGSYYFAPDFTGFDFYQPEWVAGVNLIHVLQSFTWPNTSENPFSATWYIGLTNPEMTHIIGNMGTFEFDWN